MPSQALRPFVDGSEGRSERDELIMVVGNDSPSMY